MNRKQPDYLSYLLRVWRVSGEDAAHWRASLQSPHTGERRGFASLTDLLTFLEQATNRADQRQNAPEAGEKGGGPHT
jgi:hypothetical protein